MNFQKVNSLLSSFRKCNTITLMEIFLLSTVSWYIRHGEIWFYSHAMSDAIPILQWEMPRRACQPIEDPDVPRRATFWHHQANQQQLALLLWPVIFLSFSWSTCLFVHLNSNHETFITNFLVDVPPFLGWGVECGSICSVVAVLVKPDIVVSARPW